RQAPPVRVSSNLEQIQVSLVSSKKPEKEIKQCGQRTTRTSRTLNGMDQNVVEAKTGESKSGEKKMSGHRPAVESEGPAPTAACSIGAIRAARPGNSLSRLAGSPPRIWSSARRGTRPPPVAPASTCLS